MRIKKILVLVAIILFVALNTFAKTKDECSEKWTLRSGDKGPLVEDLQRILSLDENIYPEKLVTGNFGGLTKAAVKRLQAKYGLRQVGVLGPKTAALVFPCNLQIKLEYPKGGESLTIDDYYLIRWEAINIPKFLLSLPEEAFSKPSNFPSVYGLYLELSLVPKDGSGGSRYTISQKTPLWKGYRSWKIKEDIQPGEYRLLAKIFSKNENLKLTFSSTSSDWFTITTTTDKERVGMTIRLFEQISTILQEAKNKLKSLITTTPTTTQ